MERSNDRLNHQLERLSLQEQITKSISVRQSLVHPTTVDSQNADPTDVAAPPTTSINPVKRRRKRKKNTTSGTTKDTSAATTHKYNTRSKNKVEVTGKTAPVSTSPHRRNKQPTHIRFHDDHVPANGDDTPAPKTKHSSGGPGTDGSKRPTRARRHKETVDKVRSLMSDIEPPKRRSVPVVARPRPTRAYLSQANQLPRDLKSPRPLLVILDLNGTLLYRKYRAGAAFIPRPQVNKFLNYLFDNHLVMVWSSARPENVAKICSALFTPDQQAQLVAIWARDKLRLSPAAYNEKVKVYKQLSWVWSDGTVQGKSLWSQADTVLIDDTNEKAVSEPHNLIQIDEFENKPQQRSMDILGQVTEYLMQLACQSDVSAFIRTQPFKYVPVTAPSTVVGEHVLV